MVRRRLSSGEAVRIARDLYGIGGAARELPSERDQNFHLEGPDGAFVLKVAGPAEPDGVLQLQDEALLWLEERAPELAIPRLVAARSGETTVHVDDTGGPQRIRLVTWLPGTLLADARPHAPELLGDLGRFLGRLDAALLGFTHPAAVERDLDWNPSRSLAVIARHRDAIHDPARRALVDGFVRRYEEGAAPLLPKLRKSVIHNDANDRNVLVGEPHPDARRISGLLDFGDMLETHTVSELAVATAYTVLGKRDPLAAAARVVAGYNEAFPLTEPELDALFLLACVRLCCSVSLSAHRRTAEPENPYLTVSEAPAWQALERLATVPPRLAAYTFRAACGLPACPESPAVVDWLRAHRDDIGRVVEPDLDGALVFDLSVGSPLFEALSALEETDRSTERLFGLMKERGAKAGIGRYDEARLVYTTEAFDTPEGERRTVHLAIDVFLAAGSPLFAPLDGVVRAAKDNAARLDYGPTLILRHEPPGCPPFFTLYGHLTRDSLVRLRAGDRVAKGDEIGRIGAPPENGDWPPHVHLQIVLDMLERDGEFPGVAAHSQRDVWLSLSPDPNLILNMPEGRVGPATRAKAAFLEARRRSLGPSLSVSYRRPLEIVRGFLQYLYGETGRAYLDAVNNVAHVGHSHPRVVAAGQRQMAVLNTNTRYLHDAIITYAERLAALLPDPLRVVTFVCSGSEANELALRMARAHTGGTGVVVVDGAYHGNTQGLVDVSPYKFDGPGGRGAPPHVRKVPMPDDYRGLYRRGDPARGERFAAHVGEAFRDLAERGHVPAAFLCESLLSCGGQIELPPGYLAAAYRHARAAGAVTIADEVQVGFGRVGSTFWGFQTQEALAEARGGGGGGPRTPVRPDIVTMGKPIGNGHPLAAVVTTPEIARSFANGMEYFNTFGGNPVSCAIGLAVLDVIEEERLQERAARVGRRLKAGLSGLKDRHPILGDVRGRGLFLGIELVRDRLTLEPAAEEAAYVVERMKDLGILLSTDGPLHDVIKMKPPLAFSESDADRLVSALDDVLGEDFVRSRVGS
jgi:4-aminobutyrate aminotransferase-like enzyme/Ser/Thr protein kinase RdoA (MazF antagonist)